MEQGKEKINSVPTPWVLMTSMFSPWACMISFTIERPRLVLFVLATGKVRFVKAFPDFLDAVLGDSDARILYRHEYFFVAV